MKKPLISLLFWFCVIFANAQDEKGIDSARCPSCKALHDLPSSLTYLKDSARKVFHDEDYCKGRCLLELLDTLESRFIKTGDMEYLITLDSMACYSDGYVSEVFPGPRMLHGNFKPYVDYLYNNRKRGACLTKFLVWGMEYDDFVLPGEPNLPEIKKFNNYLLSQESKYKMPENERQFIDKLMKEALSAGELNK